MLPSTAETSEPTHIEGATGSVFSGEPSADGSISGLTLPDTCANRMRSCTEQLRSRLAVPPTSSSAQVLFRIAGLALMSASTLAAAPSSPRSCRAAGPERAAREARCGASGAAPYDDDSGERILPGGDFFFEGRLVWNAAAQTLARQDAEFGFGHVDRVVAGLLDDVQFDDLLLEQAQTPMREPLGRRRAGQGDQFRLRRSVENPRPGGVRIVFAGQRRRDPFFDQSTPGAADIVDAGVQRRRDRAVAPTFARLRHVRLQQDARLRQRLCRMLARADHRLQPFALLGAQLHHIFLDRNLPARHESPPSPHRRDRDSEKHCRFNDAGDYSGYRFPREIIHQAIWLYLRFTLSFRDVEDLLAERGIAISYETVRRWVN